MSNKLENSSEVSQPSVSSDDPPQQGPHQQSKEKICSGNCECCGAMTIMNMMKRNLTPQERQAERRLAMNQFQGRTRDIQRISVSMGQATKSLLESRERFNNCPHVETVDQENTVLAAMRSTELSIEKNFQWDASWSSS